MTELQTWFSKTIDSLLDELSTATIGDNRRISNNLFETLKGYSLLTTNTAPMAEVVCSEKLNTGDKFMFHNDLYTVYEVIYADNMRITYYNINEKSGYRNIRTVENVDEVIRLHGN